MKILHYSLGFPPYRTGGLTKYCIDLMHEQKKDGNDVALLWPGVVKDFSNEVKIKKRISVNGLSSYEIINPMPVSLLNGIKEVDKFVVEKNTKAFWTFLQKNKFDVIHIHTMMGLPKEFLEVAKELKVKTIFTSHDYFGICPKVSLMYGDINCRYDSKCLNCEFCNSTAMSTKNIKIKQSRIYRTIKSIKIINKFKKYKFKPKPITINQDESETCTEKNLKNEKYVKLRSYYMKMLSLITKIHYNSSVTKETYEEFMVKTPGKVISISNSVISNHKKIKQFGEKVRIGYLGPASPRKGFFLLKDALDDLEKEYDGRFELHIYSQNCFDSKYIVAHKPYAYSELDKVMDGIDILVLPSIWHETFGFTVLEAQSYGVPVVVSSNVGAKDLISEGNNGFIFEPNKEALKEKLKYIFDSDKTLLEKMNRYIIDKVEIKTMDAHAKEILNFYEE